MRIVVIVDPQLTMQPIHAYIANDVNVRNGLRSMKQTRQPAALLRFRQIEANRQIVSFSKQARHSTGRP